MGMVYQSLPVTHCPPQKRVVLDSDVYSPTTWGTGVNG